MSGSKKKRNIKIFEYLFIPVTLLSFILIRDLFNKYYQEKWMNNDLEKIVENQPTSSPTPTSNPAITPTSAPVVKMNSNSNNYLSPNDPVHCEIHEKCGGGTTPLTREECENSVCCGTLDGNKFITKDECQKYEDTYKKMSERSPIILNGRTYYCDESAHSALKDAQELENKDYEYVSKYCYSYENKNEDLCKSLEASHNYFQNNLNSLISNHCN